MPESPPPELDPPPDVPLDVPPEPEEPADPEEPEEPPDEPSPDPDDEAPDSTFPLFEASLPAFVDPCVDPQAASAAHAPAQTIRSTERIPPRFYDQPYAAATRRSMFFRPGRTFVPNLRNACCIPGSPAL